MRSTFLILLMAASVTAASAQTAAKPATHAAKPAATSAAHPTAASTGMKLPAGIPPVKGIVKTAFSLRYEDTKIGTGAVAEPNKLYQVRYTGWLAADGRKFDSSYDHPASSVIGQDGKPVMGEDGKPKVAPGQPITFPQGYGRVIQGWDQGFEGMRIGGMRRLFIPYQLAYGVRGRPTGDPKDPGIPEKANLIFDVELVGVVDIQMPANHPGMGGMTGMSSGHAMAHPATAAPATPAAPVAPAATSAPAQPQTK